MAFMFSSVGETAVSQIRLVLNQASDEEKYDLVREGVVIFLGALAKHLAKV